MFDHILLPLSETPNSRAALPRASVLAERLACPLTLLTAVPDSGKVEEGRDLLTSMEPAVPRSVTLSSIVEIGDPAETILSAAGRHQRPLIAMPTRAAGPVAEMLFGSVTRRVLRDGGYPMLLTGPSCAPVEPVDVRFQRLVVCVDGSIASLAILPLARELAQQMELSVLLLHVIYPLVEPRTRDAALSREDREMYDLLAKTAEEWTNSRIDVEWSVDQGTWPPETIVKGIVNRGSDLVAMATHGRTALARMLTGSVAAEVVKTAPVPVLTLRPTALLH